MPVTRNLADAIIRQQRQAASTHALSSRQRGRVVLGGSSGSAGGSGGPPGGFIGRLIQSKVAYDTTEAATAAGSSSLVDNLNHIRQSIADASGDIINSSGSSTDNAIVRWDGTSGSIVQDSGVTIDDSDNVGGITTLTATNIGAFNLTGKLTAGATEIEGSSFDIDGGDISAATISGGLTWSAAQDLNNQNLTNVDIDSGAIDGTVIGGASPAAGTFTQVTVDGVADTEQLIVQAHGTQNDPLVQLQASDTTPLMDIHSNDVSNVFIGVGAGINTTVGFLEGIHNVFVGRNAGNANTAGIDDVAIGYGALDANIDGYGNLALGTAALGQNTGGNHNMAIGFSALGSVTTGDENVAIGVLAGWLTSGSSHSNVFIGCRAGRDEKGSNKLYIDNSKTATPLIYGEFDNNIVKIHGDLEIVDSGGRQLRLTHTDASKFADFTVDTNHDLTIKPSSTGQIILQPTTDSTDFFQVLDADGGTPVLNVDTTNERVGIGTSSPDTIFHIKAGVPGWVGNDYAGQIIIQNPANDVESAVVITAYESDGSGNPDQQLWYLGSSSSSNEDIIFLNRRNAKLALGTNDATRITILGDGSVGIGETNPTAKLHISTVTGGEDLLFLRDQINTADLTIDSPAGALIEIRAGVGDDLQLSSNATANQGIRIRNDGNVGIGVTDPDTQVEILNAGDQLKLSFDGTDNAVFAVDTNGDLTITASGDEIKVADWVRHTSASYRRYYHLPLASFDPGASGATWTSPTANNLCGWQLNNANEILEFQSDIHADWDGASDLEVEIKFQLLDSGSLNDTVDLKLVCYYMGIGDTGTKTQTVEVATTTDGTQFKMYQALFAINYDEGGNMVDVGDSICFVLNLEIDTSEIDNVLIVDGSLNYNTTHIGMESGDT